MKESRRVAAAVIDLVEMVPQLVRVAGPDRGGTPRGGPGCVAGAALRAGCCSRSSPHRLRLAHDHFRKGQVDEPRPGADRRRGPDRGELRRVVAERIVRRMPQGSPSCEPSDPISSVSAGQTWCRSPRASRVFSWVKSGIRRVASRGPSMSTVVGTDLADQAGDVPGAGRAVVPDREVDDPAVRVEWRNQGSHFRASSNSVHGPPSFWLRCLTTTSK